MLRPFGAAASQVVDNRAIGAIVTGTTVRQLQQMLAHGLEFVNMLVDILNLFKRTPFYISAMTLWIIKQRHQFPTFFQGKPHQPCLA